MKTVLLLGGPAAGQRTEVHGCMRSVLFADTHYDLYPLASHGEVHWFGVQDGADPLALLIAGYAPDVYITLGIGTAAIRGTSPAEAAKDFSPTKNREGGAP